MMIYQFVTLPNVHFDMKKYILPFILFLLIAIIAFQQFKNSQLADLNSENDNKYLAEIANLEHQARHKQKTISILSKKIDSLVQIERDTIYFFKTKIEKIKSFNADSTLLFFTRRTAPKLPHLPPKLVILSKDTNALISIEYIKNANCSFAHHDQLSSQLFIKQSIIRAQETLIRAQKKLSKIDNKTIKILKKQIPIEQQKTAKAQKKEKRQKFWKNVSLGANVAFLAFLLLK